jgi:hypothetical protein
MIMRLLIFVTVTVALWAQGGRGPQNREAPVTPVPFERILRASGAAKLADVFGESQQSAS